MRLESHFQAYGLLFYRQPTMGTQTVVDGGEEVAAVVVVVEEAAVAVVMFVVDVALVGAVDKVEVEGLEAPTGEP
ncbi:MAG TPA: hypothetical protein VGS04_01810 [Nitrososphaerales archaeon]|nr:hypothetical protein [Nitrososphaerales archaeon]